MVEQLAFAEVAPRVEYKLVKAEVIKMLKRYKKLPHMIAAAERRANGQGTIRLHKKDQERLINATKSFIPTISGTLYKEKALTLVDQAMHAHSNVQELDVLNGILVGVQTWGVEGALNHEYRVIPADRAWKEVYTLQNELDNIEFALERLKSYAPMLEQLLRMKYVEQYQVWQVAKEIGVSPKTYDRWKDEAIAEFATLAGILDS